MERPMKIGRPALDVVEAKGGKNKSRFVREAVRKFLSMEEPTWCDDFRDERELTQVCYDLDNDQYEALKARATALDLRYIQAVEIGIFALAAEPDKRPRLTLIMENQALRKKNALRP